MRNAVQLCLAANNILHMRKGETVPFSFLQSLLREIRLPTIFIKKQTR